MNSVDCFTPPIVRPGAANISTDVATRLRMLLTRWRHGRSNAYPHRFASS
jgi:hypothetical protein